MKYLKTTVRYLKWHYYLGYYYVSVMYKNLLVFLFEYFTIKSLIKEFFLPWKRLSGSYKGVKNISSFFMVLIQNMIMRVVGIILRALVLFVGCIVILIFIPVYPIAIVLWTVFPLLIISLIIFGIALILSLIIRTK